MREKTGNGHTVDLETFLEDIKNVVREGEELLKVGMSSLKDRAIAGARTTNQTVRQHPYASLGVGFGVGLLLGVLTLTLLTRGHEAEEED
jgi:ElaB/YqjD/DUF883 family membrane-anchored ribosome-binding protein